MRWPRWVWRIHAFLFSYFWKPCPNCGRWFSGAEMGKGPHLKGGDYYPASYKDTGIFQVTCPHCPGQYGPGLADAIEVRQLMVDELTRARANRIKAKISEERGF